MQFMPQPVNYTGAPPQQQFMPTGFGYYAPPMMPGGVSAGFAIYGSPPKQFTAAVNGAPGGQGSNSVGMVGGGTHLTAVQPAAGSWSSQMQPTVNPFLVSGRFYFWSVYCLKKIVQCV